MRYCRTTHSAQGATFDRAIIIGEAAKVATAELAYVGISRARHDVDIYTDDAEKLSGKWRQWGEKKTALEVIKF
jgi:ATP-dependent exoDNAse (exonuclease V), alpha subunit - helicase superfamily I member